MTGGRFHRVVVAMTDHAGPETLAAILSAGVVVIVLLLAVLVLVASRG